MTADADTDARALSLERKAVLCSGAEMWSLEAVPELGLPSITVSDGPHGLRKQDQSGGAGFLQGVPATCFPTAAGLAATWDRDLLREVGAALGRECVAEQVSVLLGPGVNIKRHPRGGRSFEYFSEDPLLTGEMAAALIQGVQSTGVGSSIKHFAANNQETHRMVVDVIVDERTLREIYLAGFERAIVTAGPWTVMSSYKKLNGTYASENRWLLTDVLREQWGFDGLVMSDWGGTDDRVAGVRAGGDLEMPASGGLNDRLVLEAVRNGALSEADLNRAVERVLALVRRAAPSLEAAAPFDADEHHRIVRRAAAASTVLLTNDGILPLQPSGSVAVIGAFAVEPRYQGTGSSKVNVTREDKPLDSIRGAMIDPSTVSYAAGYDIASDDLRQDLIDEAVVMAWSADVALVYVGLPGRYEAETYDRDHLRIPDQHNALVDAVCVANPNTVVVLCNGAPVQLPWVDRPRAVVEAYLGGQAGASGVADVLFGVVNPSGKLAETFALRQADIASDPWFPGSSLQVQYREGVYVGYRWFDAAEVPVLFPFGHGLSYTTFEYAPLAVTLPDADTDAAGFSVQVELEITNTGDRDGDEVVQLYVRDRESTVHRPVKELKAFAKVHVVAGATQTVRLELDRRSFAYWDSATSAWQVEGGEFELLVGSSSRDIRSSATIELTSAHRQQPPVPSLEALRRPTTEVFADDVVFTALLGHPIPAVEPMRPFTRNSSLVEAATTWRGARLKALVLKQLDKQFVTSHDPELQRVMEHAITEAPLRFLGIMSQGKLGGKTLDRLIAFLNFGTRRRR